MSELLGGWKRTKYCGDFTKADAGKEVILMGWANVRRDLGALVFVQLRDRTGLMQIVFNSNTMSEADFTRACTIRSGMRSWSKWNSFSRKTKSSSRTGPRAPDFRLFWLSEILTPWLVVRCASSSA